MLLPWRTICLSGKRRTRCQNNSTYNRRTTWLFVSLYELFHHHVLLSESRCSLLSSNNSSVWIRYIVVVVFVVVFVVIIYGVWACILSTLSFGHPWVSNDYLCLSFLLVYASNRYNFPHRHFTIKGADGTDFEGGVYHGRILVCCSCVHELPCALCLVLCCCCSCCCFGNLSLLV